MNCSNMVHNSADEECAYAIQCEKLARSFCLGCGQKYCTDHCLKHQMQIQRHFERIIHTQKTLYKKSKSVISQLSVDSILHLIGQIYHFKMKSDAIEKTIQRMEQQIENLNNGNMQRSTDQSIAMSNGLEFDPENCLENIIGQLRQDIKELKIKFNEISNDNEGRTESMQSRMSDRNGAVKSQSEVTQSVGQERPFQSIENTLNKDSAARSNCTSSLTRLLFKQLSSTMLDSDEAENETDPQAQEEDNEETVVVIDSNTTPRVAKQIRLSNNIIRLVRGPFKTILDDTMHAIDVYTEEINTSNVVVAAVKQGWDKQKRMAIAEQMNRNALKPPFMEITSDWMFEGTNANQGLSSRTIWMRNPQGQRILIKT